MIAGHLDGNFINDNDHLDQHFLVDQSIIERFISACNLSKKDKVVEIGPGKGVLTKLIRPKAKSLTVIELDSRLKEYLEQIDNINIIIGSALDVDIPDCDKIITSLPYSIIEPFMHKLIKTKFNSLYMIMGSTFVDNCTTNQITKLSLLTNTFFNVERLFNIEPKCFNPPPRTMSSAVKIVPKKDNNDLNKVIKTLYNLDEKKVKNSLQEAFITVKGITKKESKKIIESLNINDTILNKTFSIISNQELNELYNAIQVLFVNE